MFFLHRSFRLKQLAGIMRGRLGVLLGMSILLASTNSHARIQELADVYQGEAS